MKTLEQVQTQQKAIMRALKSIESVLAIEKYFVGKKETTFVKIENVQKLALVSDVLSSEVCRVKVVVSNTLATEPSPSDYGISVEGENFGYSFSPDMVREVIKRLEKSFKAVEAYTKKATKEATAKQVEIVEEKPIIEAKEEPQARPAPHKRVSAAEPVRLPQTPKKSPKDAPQKKQGASMVTLRLNRVNFDEIKSGVKTEDYRRVSKYNSRLLGLKGPDGKYYPNEAIKVVHFIEGYQKDARELFAEVKNISCDTFINYVPEGLKKGCKAITLKLGDLVEVN